MNFLTKFLGEKKGQGIRIGSRSIWDSTLDVGVNANYENENIFAFVSAYGIYNY